MIKKVIRQPKKHIRQKIKGFYQSINLYSSKNKIKQQLSIELF